MKNSPPPPEDNHNVEDNNDNNNDNMWYFAIGAMMNPTSIHLRGIHPLESQPAELLDHALYWFGPIGLAEAIEAPGKSFHGVLHRISSSEMEKLDVIEIGYDRKMGQAKLYQNDDDDNEEDVPNNRIVTVTVYTRHDADRGPHIDKIPRQRYLEIMTSGAEHYGVDPQYIQSALKEQEYLPRTLPDQFGSLLSCSCDDNNPNSIQNNNLPFMTRKDLRTNYHGKDKETPFCFTVNGKVVQWVGGNDNDERDKWTSMMKDSGEMMLSRIVYDPQYGLPDCLEDFTREHSANIENEFYEFFSAQGIMDSWRVIGRVQQTYKDDDEEEEEQ